MADILLSVPGMKGKLTTRIINMLLNIQDYKFIHYCSFDERCKKIDWNRVHELREPCFLREPNFGRKSLKILMYFLRQNPSEENGICFDY